MIRKSEIIMFFVNLFFLVVAFGFHLLMFDFYWTYNEIDWGFIIIFDLILLVSFIFLRKHLKPKDLTLNSRLPCDYCSIKVKLRNWRKHMKAIHPIMLATLDWEVEQNLVKGHSTGVFNYRDWWLKSQKPQKKW